TLLFAGALLVEGILWKSRPDKTWYDARAIAESAKTLAWKYAVRGEPFNDDAISEEDTTRSLLARLNGISAQYPHVELAAVNAPAVSTWMREQRNESWNERKEVYRIGRLVHQKNWYHEKAKYNKERSTQWRIALVVTEFLGVVAS